VPATRRILDALRTIVARGGAGHASMGDVAIAAGVSKALVHYHFRDRDSLLHALVDDVGHAVVHRARAAMTAGTEGHALDDYWSWLHDELRRGDLRILLSLAECDSERVRSACRRVADHRRELMAQHTALVFSRLGLTPRVPPALIAETVMSFADGLAAASVLSPERDPRPAFDVLWLALLALAD